MATTGSMAIRASRLDSRRVSKSPLRRLTEAFALAGMRPPIAPQLLLSRPTAKPVELDGKRILLTGASSGIGESAATQFARHGATVVAVARRKDLLDALVDRITTAGGTAIAIACDLSDMAAVDALVAEVEQRLGGVDILVNNAGRSIRRPLAESLERWHDVERTIVLNYYAPLRLIRGIAPGMLERGRATSSTSRPGGYTAKPHRSSRCTTHRRRHCQWSAGSSKASGAQRECIPPRCTTHWWPPR